MRRLPEIQVIGLDVDGVLRDTGYLTYRALCATVNELGGAPPLFGSFVCEYEGGQGYLPYYESCGVDSGKLGQVHPTFLRHMGSLEQTPLFPDVKEFLACMQESGVKIFAVSSHPTTKLEEWLELHGIHDYFCFVRGDSRDKEEGLRDALESTAAVSDETCYVGDWGLDMRAAQAVGIIPVGITRGYGGAREALFASGAAMVVEHLQELAVGRSRSLSTAN